MLKISNDHTFFDNICVLILFWGVIFTDLLFLSAICAPNPYVFDFAYISSGVGLYIFVHIAIFLVVFSFTIVMSGRAARIYSVVVSVFFSLLSLVYVAYYRFFNTLPSVSMANLVNFSNGDMPASAEFAMIPLGWKDVLFFANILVYVLFRRVAATVALYRHLVISRQVATATATKYTNAPLTRGPRLTTRKTPKIGYAIVATIAIATVIAIPVASTIYSRQADAEAKTFVQTAVAYTPLGGFLGDVGDVLTPKKQLAQKEVDDIKKYFKWNQSLYKESEYTGILAGKNLIYIQLEAFENFVINLKIDGVEVTPNLNELARKGYYFPNVHDQVRSGNSSDCDFISTTSILPANRKVGMKNFAKNAFNSLPHILGEKGYNTTYYISTPDSNWGYEDFIKGIGYDNFDYDYEHGPHIQINSYLSDGSYFEQTLPRLTSGEGSCTGDTLQLAHLVCCSTHAPFILPQDSIYFELPSTLKDTVLGRYIQAVNYTDAQIGIFIDNLKKEGALDNTVIALVGDHLGPHKYYPKEMKKLAEEHLHGVKNNYDETVPFIVYSGAEDVTPKTFSQHAGQVDVMPTLLDLLGVEHQVYKDTAMGRSLVSTSVDFAVGAKGKIFGNPSKEDRKQLKKMLRIADLILEYNYFAETSKN